jgi:hypothetical protein
MIKVKVWTYSRIDNGGKSVRAQTKSHCLCVQCGAQYTTGDDQNQQGSSVRTLTPTGVMRDTKGDSIPLYGAE